ncbi:MAG: circularly permuted type 2 ATP-grasp protein, partial [Acidimicrobiales bacterium]
IMAYPRAWIAQEVVALSTSPTHVGTRLCPRHVDLRPFAINDGHHVWVAPGGLTRVALPEGSLVVNSSQGGGSKDTWVLASTGPIRTVGVSAARPGGASATPETGAAAEQLSPPVTSLPPDPGPAFGPATQQQQQQQQQASAMDTRPC